MVVYIHTDIYNGQRNKSKRFSVACQTQFEIDVKWCYDTVTQLTQFILDVGLAPWKNSLQQHDKHLYIDRMHYFKCCTKPKPFSTNIWEKERTEFNQYSSKHWNENEQEDMLPSIQKHGMNQMLNDLFYIFLQILQLRISRFIDIFSKK